MQPAPSKSMLFPPRPNGGSSGTKLMLQTNNFSIQLKNENFHQYMYNVSITPETTSCGVSRAVMRQLVDRSSELGERFPVYDGMKTLFTAEALPFVSEEFKITLTDEETDDGVSRNFEVLITFNCIDTCNDNILPDVLDKVLCELPNSRLGYFQVGRSFCSRGSGQNYPLDGGLESLRGFYQSIRPTQNGLSLNIDMSSTAFIQFTPVIEFVTEFLKMEGLHCSYSDEEDNEVYVESLSDAAHEKVTEALRGVKVEVTYKGLEPRTFPIVELTREPLKDISFTHNRTGTKKLVVDHFQEKYKHKLKYTDLPCLQVSNSQRPYYYYLPMEVCHISGGQRYSKRLNERLSTRLLLSKWRSPNKLMEDILFTRRTVHGDNPYAEEFGIQISKSPTWANARIMPPPKLIDNEESGQEILPVGQWDKTTKRMYKGGKVNKWACVNFACSAVTDKIAAQFCRDLATVCNISGMFFNPTPARLFLSGRPDQVNGILDSFKFWMDKLNAVGDKFDLLVVILPNNNGPLYGDLKRKCETDLGIISQCCLQEHVSKYSSDYLANVALKINVKVGGKNTVLADAFNKRISQVKDKSTIIFGADVTHPQHGDDDSSPSIAAVVASQDWPEVAQYSATVCAQARRQELIQDLYKTWQDPVEGTTMHGGMIIELLKSFKKKNGKFPKKIIFYRNVVGEGQFYQVCPLELDAIRKACASLKPNYQPPVTFVVVQKRHNTMLFAKNHTDIDTVDRSGNILPGTVVDSDICHPKEFDFYLCSHAGEQGKTSRPTHYHVLCDENNFSADELQTLTYNLCYTYARCSHPVSVVPPIYYAHLAAVRARFYIDPNASVTEANVKPLLQLKENVKRVMFYC